MQELPAERPRGAIVGIFETNWTAVPGRALARH